MQVLLDRLDDLQVYRCLHAKIEELSALADKCHSPAAATAIRAAIVPIRTVGSALYTRSIKPTLDKVESLAEQGSGV
jgi:hypothetical protein